MPRSTEGSGSLFDFLAVTGPMARSVPDLALLLDAMVYPPPPCPPKDEQQALGTEAGRYHLRQRVQVSALLSFTGLISIQGKRAKVHC